MLARFKQRSWTRRTRWTPLLESQREFQRTLAKERSRVDRNGNCFGFIILRLGSLDKARSETIQLAKLLHVRLRDTDEKGHLGLGRIGIMLPETGAPETEFVMRDILKMAGEVNLKVDGEAFVYPDRENTSKADHTETLEQPAHQVEDHISEPVAMMLPTYPRWKRVMDISGALVGLALGSPLLLVSALLIKLTSRGPVLFTQARTGYLGEPFRIFKLRTMVINAEDLKASLQKDNERDGPAFKMRKDPRITLIGRFLRATGMDELPQLLNVLRGDMALVGPRPLPVNEAAQCSRWQQRRQEVRPGLTCFWQISKSRNMSFQEWMRLDLNYAQRQSLGLDVKLIVRTFASVVTGRVGH